METISKIYHAYRKGSRITTDSRDVKPGDIFIALKGEHFDGNKFAGQAVKQGALYSVVDDREALLTPSCIWVPDSLNFLQLLANHHRKQLGIPILAITGTNGKTTTKELCHAVISEKFRTVATKGNYNNHIGVPLTLLDMDETTEFGIVEMGANHPGEIKILCEIAEPDYGLITNIGEAHLEGFGTFENIVRTKGELYDYIKSHQGVLFVHQDDSTLTGLAGDYPAVTYGKTACFANGKGIQSSPFLVFDLNTSRGHLYIQTKLIGSYNADNVLASATLGLYLQIDPLRIKAALEGYTPSNLRSQLIKTERNTIILDAYNANPSSMKVAVRNFSDMKGENKLLILGEMLELGRQTEEAHRQLVEEVAQSGPCRLFLVGQSFDSLANKYTFVSYFRNTEELIDYLKSHSINSSLILIKGSRGNKLEKIIEHL